MLDNPCHYTACPEGSPSPLAMERGTEWEIRTASPVLPQEYFILMELLLYVLFLVLLTLLVFGFLRWYGKFMGGG
jgi:hypothetical protein